MNALLQLHHAGQSVWLDNIRKDLLATGTLARYISEYAVSGVTSNPTILQRAISGSADYDDAIRARLGLGSKSAEDLVFALALEDLGAAADLLRPIFDATRGADGYVSVEVSPKLAHDAEGSVAAGRALFAAADRPNLMIKVPGTRPGAVAVEALVASGIPVNVTLLFSAAQYLHAAESYLRGVERRLAQGLPLPVGSVASMFVSRWDAAADPRCLASCGPSSASPPPRRPMPPTAGCSPPTAGVAWRRAGRCPKRCCGPAPRPKIPACRTPIIWDGWPPQPRSTPSLSPPCWPSPNTVSSATCSSPTRRPPTRSSPGSPGPASMSTACRRPASQGDRGVLGVVVGAAGLHPGQGPGAGVGRLVARREHDTMQLGMIGLGRMGANLARRLIRGGHECVVYDLDKTAVKQLAGEGAVAAYSLAELAAALRPPRAAWLMVPAAVVDSTIDALAPLLAAGDIVIDGGNSYYRDDIARAGRLGPTGIHYVDVGTSGGVFGLDRGYCLMIGGDKQAVDHLDPIFATLAPGRDAAPRTPGRTGAATTAEHGYLHCGPTGAGHFVKMVHNGIEYGLMVAYAEGLAILRRAGVGAETQGVDAETAPLADPRFYRYDIDTAEVAELWRRGSVVGSWLLDLTAAALREDPGLAGFSGRVADSGEGRWTVMAAVEEGVPAHVLSAALFERFSSRGAADFADRVLSAMRKQFGGHLEKGEG